MFIGRAVDHTLNQPETTSWGLLHSEKIPPMHRGQRYQRRTSPDEMQFAALDILSRFLSLLPRSVDDGEWGSNALAGVDIPGRCFALCIAFPSISFATCTAAHTVPIRLRLVMTSLRLCVFYTVGLLRVDAISDSKPRIRVPSTDLCQDILRRSIHGINVDRSQDCIDALLGFLTALHEHTRRTSDISNLDVWDATSDAFLILSCMFNPSDLSNPSMDDALCRAIDWALHESESVSQSLEDPQPSPHSMSLLRMQHTMVCFVKHFFTVRNNAAAYLDRQILASGVPDFSPRLLSLLMHTTANADLSYTFNIHYDTSFTDIVGSLMGDMDNADCSSWLADPGNERYVQRWLELVHRRLEQVSSMSDRVSVLRNLCAHQLVRCNPLFESVLSDTGSYWRTDQSQCLAVACLFAAWDTMPWHAHFDYQSSIPALYTEDELAERTLHLASSMRDSVIVQAEEHLARMLWTVQQLQPSGDRLQEAETALNIMLSRIQEISDTAGKGVPVAPDPAEETPPPHITRIHLCRATFQSWARRL